MPRPRAEPAIHRASLDLDFASPRVADIVAGAVALEFASGPEGTRASARREGSALRIDIEAADVSSLRAAVQSALRLVEAARQVAES